MYILCVCALEKKVPQLERLTLSSVFLLSFWRSIRPSPSSTQPPPRRGTQRARSLFLAPLDSLSPEAMSYHPAVAQHLPALPEQNNGHEVEAAAVPHHTPLRSQNTAQRTRPVSMPPQAYGVSATQPPPTPAADITNTNSTNPSAKDAPASSSAASKRPKDRERDGQQSTRSRTNRLLGDYTLSKTLGAGSMGKVKLATHNITGEKVFLSPRPLSESRFGALMFLAS